MRNMLANLKFVHDSAADEAEAVAEDQGVLFRRNRSLRWTDDFPRTQGWYWIRPKSARYSTAIHYVQPGLTASDFIDTEFSDRQISRPLEADATDETALNVYSVNATGRLRERSDIQYETDDISGSTWFMWGSVVGSGITGVMVGFIYWLVMNH